MHKETLGPGMCPIRAKRPLTGITSFEHADLDDFKGIPGILTSNGHYEGVLRNLTVDGETNVLRIFA